VRIAAPAAELLSAAQRGDGSALSDLVDDWLPVVLAWCKRLGGPGVDAQDAAQDVLVLVMNRVGQVYTPDHFRPWLFGVTRRVLAKHRRSVWVRRWWGEPASEPADTESRSPERHAELSETSRQVQAALATLSVHHREVLVLCDLEHRTDEESAELLDLPVGTLKSRLRRARAAFRLAAVAHGLAGEVRAIEEAR
jgi:RNA polymerase sigma-70 factor, ECF subfamily